MFRLLSFLFILTATLPLQAAIIPVGPPPASIQTAINAANNGDTVQLSPGTYIEEIQVISKSISIVGAGQSATTIQSPNALTHLTQFFTFGVNFWCIVMIDNQTSPTPQTVDISDLTVDGSNQQDTLIVPTYANSDRFFAIGYHNASGTIQNVHTTNTRQTANFNQLAGGGMVNASNTATTIFNVTNCLVDFYQRIGIDCRGNTLTAHISNNTVDRGYVLTPNTSTATPNGIQFLSGTLGDITGNTIKQNIATVSGAASGGIIVSGAGTGVVLSNNTLDSNDVGIAALSNDSMTLSNNNYIFPLTPGVNPPEGLLVQDPTGTTIIASSIFNNYPSVNLNISSSTNQVFQLSNNQFIGSQTGLLITGSGAAGPIVTMDGDSFVGTAGYYIQEVAAPNNVWPSTATVSFDGLTSGFMTFAQFNAILTKIFDQHNDPALGLVLDFIPPIVPAPPVDAVGLVTKNKFVTQSVCVIEITWEPSPSENTVSYNVYHDGILIGTVRANKPLVFTGKFLSPNYQITTVNSVGMESDPVNVVIEYNRSCGSSSCRR